MAESTSETRRDVPKRFLITMFLFTAVLAADQITKAFIVSHVPQGRHEGTSRTFFYITHERNPGLVFGIFRDIPIVAKLAPVAATVILLLLYRFIELGSFWQPVAFGLVAGGAIGNLIDRFLRGTVVDFLQFNFYFLPDWLDLPTKRYPAFNLADSAICVGVALLIFTWHHLGSNQESDAPSAA